MSVSSGLECLFCLAFTCWARRRCTHSGTLDSASWPEPTPSSFEPVPRACRAVLAVYEDDLSEPRWAPQPLGYQMDPASLLHKSPSTPRSPPYIIYLHRPAKELILALRGLNLSRDSDYKLLLENATHPFDSGHVHRGLLKSAVWVLNREAPTLATLMSECGPEYKLVFAGHSLGAGVAALMAAVAVNHLERLGGIPRSSVCCYALAPPRCMSLDLAVKYADVIHSVVLQDDFLPRTPTPPLEHISGSIFSLFLVCLRGTFTSEEKKLRDPRRLYAPGQMNHIVERKPCSCRRFPPEVRTAIPVEGRFEHIVLSCNAIFDHRIVWIEREAQRALDIMKGSEEVETPPTQQRMERELSLKTEHKDAMERALLLDDPRVESLEVSPDQDISPSTDSKSGSSRSDWDELVDELFDEDETDDT